MYHKQLVTHVAAKLQKGVPKEIIQKELNNDGWSEDDIREAFYYSAFPEKLRQLSFIRDQTLSYTINLPVAPSEKRNEFSYGEQPALSNPDFFGKVKQQFIDDKASFVEADLSAMILRVYKAGELSLEVPIDTKGREGSWWETPAGLYKISSKEKAHFSGIGHVWMPWSMNFQGNFYIHGRIYYPDGTLTSTKYTGGCIRLSTEDAKKVFEAVDVGTPVLVFEHSFSSDNFTYAQASPALSAPIYLDERFDCHRIHQS